MDRMNVYHYDMMVQLADQRDWRHLVTESSAACYHIQAWPTFGPFHTSHTGRHCCHRRGRDNADILDVTLSPATKLRNFFNRAVQYNCENRCLCVPKVWIHTGGLESPPPPKKLKKISNLVHFEMKIFKKKKSFEMLKKIQNMMAASQCYC